MLLTYNWPMLFLLIYISVLLLVFYRSNHQWKETASKLQSTQNVEEILLAANKYLKRNPFAQQNSTLRLVCIPLLIVLNKSDLLSYNIKKIRAVDLDLAVADYLVYVLFFLKESGKQVEYQELKRKCEKSYKPCKESVCRILIQETVKAQDFTEEMLPQNSRYMRGVFAYYLGVEYWNEDEKGKAKEQFELVQQALPHVRPLLERQGFIQ